MAVDDAGSLYDPLAHLLEAGGDSHLLVLDHRAWGVLILYCCVASVVPVWALLQPRDYLGGFVLYSALLVGVIGVLFGDYQVQQPAFKGFNPVGGMTGAMFPFLFVTIACGASSGFHGLVCSGTTCKQVEKESHMRPIGCGAMLAEAFVALIALVTIMIVAPESTKGMAPGTIYGNGIGRFLTLVIGEDKLAFAVTFGAMAFADSYSALPRHEIARVSELLQSQLLQPININPVQPHLAESNLFILDGAGPGDLSFNEFNPLFNRDR